MSGRGVQQGQVEDAQDGSDNKDRSSIDEAEIARFAAIADEWWDPNGKFRPLHQFNPVRVRYIKEQICEHWSRDPKDPKALTGLSILDIGCGGGLLSEPLTRMGADVTGIDPGAEGVEAARIHAEASGLQINYQAMTAEDLLAQGFSYDVVLAMEVVEHVADVRSFLSTVSGLVKPGGLCFGATINRTPKAYALAIVGAERILRWLPAGTHSYKKLVTPKEFSDGLERSGLCVRDKVGTEFNPLTQRWSTSRDLSVNYMLYAEKI